METVVRAACPHDCPDTCAMLVTVRDGVAVKVAGDPTHPFTDGSLCTKVSHYAERTYSPDRLLHPLRRVGPKGKGEFKRITWDEALDEIAERLKALAAEDPETILPLSYAGTMGMLQYSSMDRRFFHKLGATQLERTLCSSAGKAGIKATLGGSYGMDPEHYQDSKLIVIWGSNPITSNLHFWSRAQEAKRRGAKLIAIDPYRSLTAEKCHEHIALLPGTDAALALGLVHVLERERWLDEDYIEKYTLGADALLERAREFTPERVADICGITAAQVESLARDYATTRPAAIRLNYGMQRARGGGNAVRAIACLPALAGHWRDAAGGLLLSTSGEFHVNGKALYRPELLAGRKPRTINMSTIGRDLAAADPPIDALIVYNSNPVAVAPESRSVAAGFARDDLFTVVLEHFQTDTADYADYVLPATTQLEHTDVHKTYGHLYMLANNAAIAPLGEALPNSEIFRRLAAKMGFDEPCFRESDDEIAAVAFDEANFDWQSLKKSGWQRLDRPKTYAPFANGGFPTKSGECEIYSERVAALGLDPVPGYLPPTEVADEGLAQRYPLAMISPPARNYLNSTFVNVQSLRDAEGEPHLEIHPLDAAARGIESGARVRVFNDRGSLELKARVTDKARPGVVVALSVWWKKLALDGKNANELTNQTLTDIGRAPTFYDCRVELELA